MDSYVSKLINRLNIELNLQKRNGVYGFTQRNLAYNSNRIEGSKLSYDQTSSLFETKTIKADADAYIKSKDIEEATGHFVMFNEMLHSYKSELSEDLIKSYHFALKSGVFEDRANGYPAGEYKNRANIVSDIITAKPSEVSSKMEFLLHNYHLKHDITLLDIAEFHVEYENIHPFQDGNGRTGRIIMFKECLKNNIFPFIIEDENKQRYYDALHTAQISKNYEDLIALFKEEQEKYFNNVKDFIIEE